MYAIAALQIISVKDKSCTGIEFMETNNFRLNCYQTLTGVKFLLISDLKETSNKDLLLRKIYELYTDFALKNPFYKLDMPIRYSNFGYSKYLNEYLNNLKIANFRCELFDYNISQLLENNDKIMNSGDPNIF